jgi:hypothetical protein
MTYDNRYLGRQLNDRSQKVGEAFGAEVAQILGKASVSGTANNSRTYLQFSKAGMEILEREVNDAIQFAYNYTGEHDGPVFEQVSYCATQMVEKIIMMARSRNSSVGADIINKMDVTLRERKDALLDSFRHGMIGSQKLKKDPVVSIVSNQTNSPGAIQQVGVGDFSQKAFVQNHQPLIDAVNKALASLEYQKLEPAQKDAFKDVADTLLDEAKKETPDPGKLKRWGHRLAELGTQLGLHVAATEIVHIVTSMFSGGG